MRIITIKLSTLCRVADAIINEVWFWVVGVLVNSVVTQPIAGIIPPPPPVPLRALRSLFAAANPAALEADIRAAFGFLEGDLGVTNFPFPPRCGLLLFS